MSAAELRQAAETLRERADLATAGPWTVDPDSGADGFAPLVVGQNMAVCETFDGPHPSDATYIATMHPAVGLALADWLDIIASKEKAREGVDSPIPVLYLPEALTIARAINGGAA